MKFPSTSRYADVETATFTAGDGTQIVYVRRRFIPSPDRFELLHEHAVEQGDRLDNLTALYLDDPEAYWRICDANGVVRPDELTEVIGRRVRITLPEGVRGTRG